MQPADPAREGWRWLGRLAAGSGRKARGWLNLDTIIEAMVEELPELRGVRDAAPGADYRLDGQRIPRKALRESGRTAVTANLDIHEPRPDVDPDSPLSHTMEGFSLGAPSGLNARFWYPGWNSDQALNKFQIEVGGPLIGGDPGVCGSSSRPRRPGIFHHRARCRARRDGLFQVVPRYHVFGSDELSVLSPGVAQRAPRPYIALSRADADRLGLTEGQTARVAAEKGASMELPVVIRELPSGLASLPFGLKGLPEIRLPGSAESHGRREMSAVGIAIIVILGVMLGALGIAAGTIWFERRLLGVFQERYGPNRAGPFGVLQVIADMLKIFTKENWIPPFADKAIFVIAPAIIMITTLASFAVIPIAPAILVSDLDIGLLYFLAMSSFAVYSVALAGWASNNKYSLLGSVRAVGQMVSYEVFMGLSLMGVVLQAGSFSMRDIVVAQRGLWYVVPQFVGFVVFFIAGLAETRRIPFDIPEAESELVAGYHTEYSGFKFAMFYIGEYVGITLISMMVVTLFFGGWQGPVLPPVVWFLLKTLAFIGLFILVRAALPRPRYDQLLSFGWKLMLPLALLNLAVTGGIVLAVGR